MNDKNVIYSKTLTFDNLDFYHDGNKNFRAEIQLELRDVGENKIEFSGTGVVYKHGKRNCETFGQCIDEIAKALPENKTVQRINKIWSECHLNTMHAGCKHQRHLEEKPYDEVKNTYCDICDYIYGHGWVYEPIPQEIIDEIKSF